MKEVEARFFNRELSWIEFNARVLHEACRKELPTIERLKYIAIVSSNFDEFFQVRVAAIKRLKKIAPHHRDCSGRTPEELLKEISTRCHQITKVQHSCFATDVLPELARNGLTYIPSSSYTEQQKSYLSKLFKTDIMPVLTNLRTDGKFPSTENMRLYAAFLLERIPGIQFGTTAFDAPKDKPILALVPVPTNLQRVIWIPSPKDATGKAFTVLDDIIMTFGEQLFPGYTTKETLIFKVARDADFSVNESGQNLTQAMQDVLIKRRTSGAIRLLCNAASPVITSLLIEKLNLTADDVYEFPGLIDPSSFLDAITQTSQASSLTYPQWHSFHSTDLPAKGAYWDTLQQHDVLLHVPYESYDAVVNFLNSAATDENVLAIKMTLYRTGSNSPIVKALEQAAQSGKQVTVFVELKARFDERRNIGWAEELERSGAIVIYGVVGLKVHAKMLIVIRRENDGLRRYVHLSTGNYNPKTAKLYSDLSLLTSNPEIANDATLFFNTISGYSQFLTLKHLSMAPINMKSKIMNLIEREIQNSTPERPGLIMAKMNSLGHEGVIKALYRASQAGVRVYLNVRGICMLVPGVKGLSENIKVVSIVDRYLEHSRIFYFQNGGSEELFISSADWMPRNLERRVELMVPIADEKVFKTIKETLDIYFKDNSHSHTLQSDGRWIANKPGKRESNERAQEVLYKKYRKLAELHDHQPHLEFVTRRNS